jgi:hypothetical protein
MASPRCDHLGLGDPALDLGGGSVLTAASFLLVGTAKYMNLWSVPAQLLAVAGFVILVRLARR